MKLTRVGLLDVVEGYRIDLGWRFDQTISIGEWFRFTFQIWTAHVLRKELGFQIGFWIKNGKA